MIMLKAKHYNVMSVSLSILITTDDAQQSSTPSEKAKPEVKDSSSRYDNS